MSAAAILRLQRSGFTQEQVEALADYLDAQLATKGDLALLRADLAGLATKAELAEAKSDVIRWVVGTGLVQVLALVGAVIAIARFFPGGAP